MRIHQFDHFYTVNIFNSSGMAGFPNSNSMVVFEEAIPAPTSSRLAQFEIHQIFSPQ